MKLYRVKPALRGHIWDKENHEENKPKEKHEKIIS
jgi:hypothetical protein